MKIIISLLFWLIKTTIFQTILQKIGVKIWENRSQWFETIVIYCAILSILSAIIFLMYVFLFPS